MLRFTILFFQLALLAPFHVHSQRTAGSSLLITLDSVRNSPSISKYFAEIYFQTTGDAIRFFSGTDSTTQLLMSRLEARFAGYFLRSAIAKQDRQPIPEEWKSYYADSAGTPLRYLLYGINAHINGDIWQALTQEFSLQELRMIRSAYFRYEKGLRDSYKTVYDYALKSNPKFRLLHYLSFGIDQWYGQFMLKRWRTRQMRLAELYFTKPARFKKRLTVVKKKMCRLNSRIQRNT